MQELVNGLHQVPAAETADVGDTTVKRRIGGQGDVNAAALFTTGRMPWPCDAKEGDLSAGEQHVVAILYAREDKFECERPSNTTFPRHNDSYGVFFF